MKPNKRYELSTGRKGLRWVYILTMVVMGFTGFGQMPIFKRYYISDIPGMGWSADFYMTHYIHYIGAVVLLGLISYFIFEYFFSGRKEFRLTSSAYVQIVLLGGIVITGILRVLKNLPDILFSPAFTMFIDISHLGFMMVYLFVAIFFLSTKKGWIASKA